MSVRSKAAVALLFVLPAGCLAQDRLATMPGFDQYSQWSQGFSTVMRAAFKGFASGSWSADGNAYIYRTRDGVSKFDLATEKVSTGATMPSNEGNGFSFDRSHQAAKEESPDKKHFAVYRDRNVYITDADGSGEQAVTTEGSAAKRIKFGNASWVYGEELAQDKAMWWSPDSSELAYYRFDESQVPDYFLSVNQLSFQDSLATEAYPKPGKPNPIAELYVYNVATKQRVKIDTTFDSGGGPDLGHYVFDEIWSPDGKSFLYFRMNRMQNVLEFVSADPVTGKSKVVFRESNPNGWVEPKPNGPWPTPEYDARFLPRANGEPQRFLYISERSGYRNIYLGSLPDGNLKPVTQLQADVGDYSYIDNSRHEVWYTAHDGANPYLVQLHRVKMDGTDDVKLTDPAYSHSVSVSPSGKAFADVEQTYTKAPTSVMRDGSGKQLAILASPDTQTLSSSKYQPLESFSCKAADGVTTIYGRYSKPSNFDPSKKYPLLLEVYGGPGFGTEFEQFTYPSAYADMGFIVAWIDGRGSIWRGRAFAQALYKKLGQVEVDDQIAGIKYLSSLPFVDGSKVGIYGTSYGGYLAIMAAVRYPDIVKAACLSSAVTDWRNYDSTYTERYMGVLQGNEAAYDAGSAMTYVKNLKGGHLLIYYGTADDNVHPSNSLMLVTTLAQMGKSYEMAVGPDQAHSGVDDGRCLEFFVDHLVLGR